MTSDRTTNGGGTSIVLVDDVSKVPLIPAGAPALGSPTRVTVESSRFAAAFEAEAKDYAAFRDALVRLHQTLAGEARLGFWDEDHSIVLTGDGRGGIEAVIKVADSRRPSRAYLAVTMKLDQSYLPSLIQWIGREFVRS